MTNSALFMAVFLACAVEAVEALTIILAAGTARDWRSSITGLLAGMVTLAAVVALLGPALSAIPLDGLRLFVGGLLLVFGLQWLRKAILRASGHKALHDEAMVFEVDAGRGPAGPAFSAAAWCSTGTPSRCRTRASCSRAWKSHSSP